MKFVRVMPALLLLALYPGATARADTQLQRSLSGFPERGALGYLEPLRMALGQSFNSRLYHQAGIHPDGYRMHMGVNYFRVGLSADDRGFVLSPGSGFHPASGEGVPLPTVAGSSKSTVVAGADGRTYIFPGGWDLSSYTLVVPQLTIDGADGSEVMFRWGASFESDPARNLGRFWILGVGARHDISRHLGRFPIDLSAGVFIHTMSLGQSFLNFKTFSGGIQGGRDWARGSVYGGLSYDVSSLKVSYTERTGLEPVETTARKTGGTGRLTLGSRVSVHHVEAGLEFNLAEKATFSASLGAVWP